MKKHINTLLAVAVIAACGLFTGCASTRRSVDESLFQATQFVTNQVAEHVVQVKTNQVVIVTMTNQLGEVIGYTTNREPIIVPVTIPAHQEIKPIAWQPNPNAVATAQGVGSLFGPYGALGATAFTTILGAIAAFRGKKYKDAAISLAQGVQHAAEAFPDKSAAIINIQKQVQDSDGTRAVVDSIIDKFVITKPTTS